MQRLMLQWLLWSLLILLRLFLLGSIEGISDQLLLVLSLHPFLVGIVDFRLLFGRSVGIGAKVLLLFFVAIAPLELQLVISLLRDLPILLAVPASALQVVLELDILPEVGDFVVEVGGFALVPAGEEVFPVGGEDEPKAMMVVDIGESLRHLAVGDVDDLLDLRLVSFADGDQQLLVRRFYERDGDGPPVGEEQGLALDKALECAVLDALLAQLAQLGGKVRVSLF